MPARPPVGSRRATKMEPSRESDDDDLRPEYDLSQLTWRGAGEVRRSEAAAKPAGRVRADFAGLHRDAEWQTDVRISGRSSARVGKELEPILRTCCSSHHRYAGWTSGAIRNRNAVPRSGRIFLVTASHVLDERQRARAATLRLRRRPPGSPRMPSIRTDPPATQSSTSWSGNCRQTSSPRCRTGSS